MLGNMLKAFLSMTVYFLVEMAVHVVFSKQKVKSNVIIFHGQFQFIPKLCTNALTLARGKSCSTCFNTVTMQPHVLR